MVARLIEKILFASRWLLAPLYFTLVAALFIVLIKAGQHVIELCKDVFILSESHLMLGILSLVDLTLAASLVVIVIFSGYENFVSRIDPSQHVDWPEWMARIDFSSLKLKLMASIVAISAVQLLRVFMEIGEVSDRELLWSAALHLVFVFSTLALAYCERLSSD
jgi:uncharacterized protein (TIGR00645 family)